MLEVSRFIIRSEHSYLVLHFRQCMAFASFIYNPNSKLALTWFYLIYVSTHFSMCVWRMLTLAKESCDSWWYLVSSSFLHSGAYRDDQSDHLSLGLQSGLSCVASSRCSMLGLVNPTTVIHIKGLHISMLPFSLPHSQLFCLILVSVISFNSSILIKVKS